jgi:outer membrane protein assembly factor BamB
MQSARSKSFLMVAYVAFTASTCSISAASIWPQFRGPNCSGVSDSDKPPVEFGSTTNLLWKIELPPGLSSPCVWQERIFLTGFESNKLETICIRRRDGNILWRQTAPAEKIEATNPTSSPASATPATDGKRVYVYFGSFGVLAYDFKGGESWLQPLPVPALLNGSGTSPALMEGRLIINRDQEEGKSSVLALDARTGRALWETPRPEFFSSYGTPVLWKRGKISEVVLTGSYRVVGYDLKSGSERWSARGLEALSVCPTPVIGDDQLYAMSYSFGGSKMPTFAEITSEMDKDGDHKVSRDEAGGFLKAIFDLIDKSKDAFVAEEEWNANLAMLNKGEHGVFAVRAPGDGDVTATHVAWKQKRGAATVSSPLFYQGRVYMVQDGGRVTCYEAKRGNLLFEQERLDADGEYHASPVAANGKVYFASTRGVVSAIEAGNTLKVLARNNLAERIAATPAITDNKLYIRTATHLWAFGE